MRNFVCLGAVAFVLAVGARGETIVGGYEAGRWPWQVMLSIQNSERGQRFCGGSLVAHQWVLTDADCIRQRSPIKVLVGTNERDAKSSGMWINVEAIERHQDIALLRLTKSATEVPGVRTVRFAEDATQVNEFVNKGALATVAGWGEVATVTFWRENEAGQNFPSRLMETTKLPLVDWATCREYNNVGAPDENTLCAGYFDGGKGLCRGDEGGPLVVNDNGEWIQIGIASVAAACIELDRKSVV